MDTRVAASYGKIPLSFEANQGQADPSVQFLSRGSGYSLFLTPGEAVLSLERQKAANRQKPGAALEDTVRMKLVGANAKAAAQAADPQPGVVSYFIGNDPKKWHAGIRTYGKVNYTQIYPGVDLVFYGNQRQLEYDFVVAPGADPSRIAWQIDGAAAKVDADGNLVLTASHGPASFEKPVIYQIDGDRKIHVDGAFEVAAGRVRFRLSSYDHARALVIDPVLSYATYLGGSLTDNIGSSSNGDGNSSQALAVDGNGSAYVTGYTYSTDFPLKSPYQTKPAKSSGAFLPSVFVSKFSPDGSSLEYSTYLGGSENDLGYAIAVDSAGSAYVTGVTSSPDFPVTGGAYQTICGANWTSGPGGFTRTTSCPYYESAYVTKLTPDGTGLAYSTFLSGFQGSYANAITVDSLGRAYVTGWVHEACDLQYQPAFCPFPTTAGAVIAGSATGGYSPDYIFVSVFDPTGADLLYSTLYGDLNGVNANARLGSGNAEPIGIALDGDNNFYVTGTTQAGALATTAGAFQPTSGPLANNGRQLLSTRGFVAKFNALTAGGSSLAYGTYLGGHKGYFADTPSGITADAAGNVYVDGTSNSYDFPVTQGAFQTSCGLGGANNCSTGFVTKLNPEGSALVWSSYLGNTPALEDNPTGNVGPIVVDKSGDVFVAGKSGGVFYFVNPIETAASLGTAQAFITEFNPTGSKLLFSSYVGATSASSYSSAAGLAVDGEGNIYVAGNNFGGTLITSPGAFQATFAGDEDGFVVKIAPHGTATTTLTASPSPAALGKPVTLTATVAGPANSTLTTGTVTFRNGTLTLGTGKLNAAGTATMTTSSLLAGTHSLTAAYSGDSTYAAGTSAVTALTVDKYGSTTTLTASSTPVFAHQTVTFTAHVTPGGGNPLATGSVTFMDGAKPIGSIYLNASGTAVFSTALLATGSHSVTAVYSGNASLTPSTSAAVVVQILAKVATSTTIATSAAKIVAGASVTFTARVKPATGTVIPTGTVTFHDVNATIGTGTLDGTGSATFTTSTLAVGPHSISAAYGGDAGNLSSVSAAVKVNVTAK